MTFTRKTYVGPEAYLNDLEQRVADEFAASRGVTIPEGTTLPATPAAGDLFILIADDTNGVDWLFRRNAANTQWRFVGGPDLVHELGTSGETTASTTYTDLTTVGPTIAVPAAGLYLVTFGSHLSPGAAASAAMGVSIDAATPAVATEVVYQASATAQASAVTRTIRASVAAAGNIVAKYKTSAGTLNVSRRFVAVRPVRL